MLPVSLWPCAKLARGVALISTSVWSGLVQPEQGQFLALYSLKPAGSTGDCEHLQHPAPLHKTILLVLLLGCIIMWLSSGKSLSFVI